MKFTEGMNVIIPDVLTYTERKYTVNSDMKSLIGTVQRVDKVEDERLTIQGWSWSKKDFQVYYSKLLKNTKKDKKSQIQYFNPNQLVI